MKLLVQVVGTYGGGGKGRQLCLLTQDEKQAWVPAAKVKGDGIDKPFRGAFAAEVELDDEVAAQLGWTA